MAHPSLLGLPRELRDKIYRFLLASEHALRPGRYAAPRSAEKNLPTELIRVNKQLQAEASQAIVESHNILLGWHQLTSFSQEVKSHRPLLLIAPRLDIRIFSMAELASFIVFVFEHHCLKDLRVNFTYTVGVGKDYLKECHEPYEFVPLGRFRLPGEVHFTGCIYRNRCRYNKSMPESDLRDEQARDAFREFLKVLERRVKGNTPPDDPTPLFEGQDMSRLMG
ncbi:hypothetical protein FKW77_003435 [Venturia effusa]|uniref:F-box domain-containing protein n=1 Tax=Venturia effusa TaxID=50376 RepID=A0A517KW02_9PEZI|nr:hypothetical protein FKW77_003435 [Venturia effusa]